MKRSLEDEKPTKLWSATQSRVLTSVLEKGKNVLITGAGGVGKSEVIKEIVSKMKDRGLKVAVVAQTGIAALTIGGQTLWSFMHFNMERIEHSKEEIVAEYVSKHKYWCLEFQSLKTLIIDEVSMVEPQILELMDYILQMTRRDYRPFGGMQLVLVGDFFQLPAPNKIRKYIFHSEVFWKSVEEMHDLKEMWRQNNKEFISLLHRARKGEQTLEDIKLLNSRVGIQLECESRGILPTILYSHNEDVDKKNAEALEALDTQRMEYKVKFGTYESFSKKKFDNSEATLLKLLKTLNLGDSIDFIKHPEFKIGAQVMLCYNLGHGLVNGSRGVIIDYSEGGTDEEEKFKKKSQESIYPSNEKLPIVRFVNGKVIKIPYVRYTMENCYAWRIGIKLCWATSIHKSQSLTLDACKVELSKCFDAGMAYVALSRINALENLRLKSPITQNAFQVDQEVIKFYDTPFAIQKSLWIAKKSMVEEMKSETELYN